MIFKSVHSGMKFDVEYEPDPFDVGSQGTIHRIKKINGKYYKTWVIKIIKSLDYIAQLSSLVSFISYNKLNTEGLSCSPAALLQRGDFLAIPMRYASGVDLENGGGLPNNFSLIERLAVATELARCVRRLHESGAVIGDLSYDNIVIDCKNYALYLVDIDSIGFQFDNKSYSPLASNIFKGELSPPEFSNSRYTQQMDLWSLSVILYFIITNEQPMASFGLINYTDPKITWPPQSGGGSCLSKIDVLGGPLQKAFLKSFNEARLNPNQRLLAREWEKLLNEAQDHIYQCRCSPDKPFVALDLYGQIMKQCPICHQPISPPLTGQLTAPTDNLSCQPKTPNQLITRGRKRSTRKR